jgi:hypothetical protein
MGIGLRPQPILHHGPYIRHFPQVALHAPYPLAAMRRWVNTGAISSRGQVIFSPSIWRIGARVCSSTTYDLLREAFRYVGARHPLTVGTVVVLSVHFHLIFFRPEGNADDALRA